MTKPIDLNRRLAYLGISDRDTEDLRPLRSLVADNQDAIVAAFYGHLLSYDEPRQLLTDPIVRDRLMESQKAYLRSLVGDSVDASYVDRRNRIGRVHERIGLDPAWYLGAYEIYFSELDRLSVESGGIDSDALERARTALRRRVLLDAQLAMEAYIEKREEQLEFVNRELAAAHRGLTREVGEKNAALKETTARAKAAEQLAAVGVLAAGLAHEIGTPMGVIRGHAESLTGRVSDERSRWRVDTIIEQIDRITNIMHSLLNLARPRAPVIEPVALGEVMKTALSFLSEKLERRSIGVVRSLDDVPPMMGDGEKLQQLFLNLILNAADAMPDGGTLTLRLVEGSDGSLHASVRDTGIGIEASDLAHVFEPFFTTKAAGQGSGLGLVVARGIAIDHGGDVEITSEPGHGTEFKVRLPVGEELPPIEA